MESDVDIVFISRQARRLRVKQCEYLKNNSSCREMEQKRILFLGTWILNSQPPGSSARHGDKNPIPKSHDQVTKYQQEVPPHTRHKDLYVLAFLGREAAVLVMSARSFKSSSYSGEARGEKRQIALPIDKRELAICVKTERRQSNDAL